MSTNLQQWNDHLAELDSHGALPAFAPGASVTIAAADADGYVNGMKDAVGGRVTLKAAEDVRARALASSNHALVAWATNGSLPDKFFHMAARTEPALGLTEADKFTVAANCQNATSRLGMFGGNTASVTWWPQCFEATPDPTGKSFWIRGAHIADCGAFAADNPKSGWKGPTIAELPALFEAAYEFKGH